MVGSKRGAQVLMLVRGEFDRAATLLAKAGEVARDHDEASGIVPPECSTASRVKCCTSGLIPVDRLESQEFPARR